MNRLLSDPDTLRQKALRFYERGRIQASYLENDDSLFPLHITLKKPGEKVIRNHFDTIRNEVKALENAGLPLEYKTFRFASLGEQRLPVAIVFDTRDTYLDILGLTAAFEKLREESALVLDAFHELKPLLVEKPKLIETYTGDWERIVSVCRYLVQHPKPDIYLRQLPVEGVDTKFVESRKKVLDLLLTRLLPESAYDTGIISLVSGGFEQKYGFRTPPPTVRFRLLDPTCFIAGLDDITLPANKFASLTPEVETVFVVENLATFLAFPAYPRGMVIFGSGYGARYLSEAQWLRHKRLYYWGDLDSHGFSILSHFRQAFPNVRSLMMDTRTAERFAHLAVTEPEGKRFRGTADALSQEETALFEKLRQRHFRLEQERIPYTWVEQTINNL